MDENKKYEIEVLTRLTKIETILESLRKTQESSQQTLKEVEEKSSEAYTLSKDNEKRLDKIEDNNKWLFRTTVGAVITGLIAIGLNFFK